jgi:two-component system response regulator AtoC
MARILVVDDDANVRAVLAETLVALGCEVTEAADGTIALELVPRIMPDAVCLDLWMDGLPGLEVLDRLTREHPGLPVVIVTADPLIDTMRDARAHGAFGYIRKPFDLGQLRQVLASALGRPRAT